MSYASNNLHPRLYPRLPPSFRRKGGARVIALRRRRPHPFAGLVIGFALVAVAAWICIGTMLAVVARTGHDVFGRVVPGWPLW